MPVTADIDPPAPGFLHHVSFTAPGFVVREQLHDGKPTYLWPAPPGYVDDFVYLPFRDGTYGMVRWRGDFTVTLDGELAEIPSVVDKTREVLDEAERWTGLKIAIGPGGACIIRLDPDIRDDGAIGAARWTFSGVHIVAAELRFATRQEITGGVGSDYANTLLHEFGHALGLLHSPNTRDVMTPGRGRGTQVAGFQEHEGAALHMMYQHRVAGNRRPDRAADTLSASSLGTWTAEILD